MQTDKIIIITVGFSYSGSGLVNDWLLSNGFEYPSKSKILEFKSSTSHFSWVDYYNGTYTNKITYVKTKIRLIKSIVFIFVKNLLKRSILYRLYLGIKYSREYLVFHLNSIHKRHGIRGEFSSLIANYQFGKKLKSTDANFDEWFNSRFIIDEKPLRLFYDKGAPSDIKILRKLNFKPIKGIIVYRDPIIMFTQQDIANSLNTTIYSKDNDERFKLLISTYKHYLHLMENNDFFIPISFDTFLYSADYRADLKKLLNISSSYSKYEYDFSESIKNDNYLKKLVKNTNSKFNSDDLNEINQIHKKFVTILNKKLSVYE